MSYFYRLLHFLLFFFTFLGLSSSSSAVDLLYSSENSFFRSDDHTRIGIEVEFKGISPRQVAEIVARRLGGTIQLQSEKLKTTIQSYDANGSPLYNELLLEEFEIVGTRIGRVILKPDTNQIDDDSPLDNMNQVVELVTEPIRYPEVEKLDLVLTDLKQAGALGTDSETAVSTQVNVEMFEGKKNKVRINQLLDIMRVYLRPEHHEQIEKHLEVPAIRKPYLANYSPGFMKILLDPRYHPSARELFDDYVYRQSLEFLGDPAAWLDSIDEVKRKLLQNPKRVVPQVVKQNRLRVSSLLIWLFPDDPMSQHYEDTGWAVARPLIEFREWNNDFKATSPTKQALGLINAVVKYGYFDHDSLMSQLSGVNIESFPKLREKVYASRKTGEPLSFRYYLGNKQHFKNSRYSQNEAAYSTEVFGAISPQYYGKIPLFIPGESIVLHRSPIHEQSVRGKYEPNLTNRFIRQALENKWIEYLYFQELAPGAMPKARLLSNFISKKDSQNVLEKKFQDHFPNGFILKGVWDLGSERMVITDESNFLQEIEAYRKSDFDLWARKIRKRKEMSNASPEVILDALKKHPNFLGWKINQVLRSPDQFILQERVRISKEFRVEILGGRVIGGSSTLDRYAYEYFESGNQDHYKPPSSELLRNAEHFAQTVVNQLPPKHRGMPMAMDVALLEDGSWVMIESNPGGNSNFLYEESQKSIQRLTEYLKDYVEKARQGDIPLGMSDEAQMDFLKKLFKKWKIKVKDQFPGFEFLDDKIIDTEFKRQRPDPKQYHLRKRVDLESKCESVFSGVRRLPDMAAVAEGDERLTPSGVR